VTRARALAALAVALLLGGCVYYNGMYNTKRLAGSARKAERDGRVFEANNLWGQVITRAESLVARHPDSKYVDEALVLKGLALARLRQCQAAVAPLGRLTLLPDEAEVREEASLALGRCNLELGEPQMAAAMFARVAESEDPARRAEARLLWGRALRQVGRPEEALSALENLSDAQARDERLLALAAAGRSDAALALADSLLATRDTIARWDTVAATVGRVNPLIASALVDRLKSRTEIRPEVRARLLYEDGMRLLAVDRGRGEKRLTEVASLSEPRNQVERARLQLLLERISRATSAADLRSLSAELEARVSGRSTAASEAGVVSDLVARVLTAVDSASAGAAQADLRLFLAAETARDSLAAPALAVSLFRTIVESLPESPYAPKAILAGHALDPAWGETVMPLLQERYGSSPYVALAQGAEPYGYQELEDSLQIFARGLVGASGEKAPGPMLPEDSIAAARRGLTPRPRRGLEP
jgi:tetratricopeptide (TPR) repeat protein